MSAGHGISSVDDLLEAISRLVERAHEIQSGPALSASTCRSVDAELRKAADSIQGLLLALDPIKQPAHMLDPSDPSVVGRLIATTMLLQARHKLTSLPQFYGSGVYALYYNGDFEAYQPVRRTDTPVYVGKADPATPDATTTREQGTRLWRRLNDHRRSLSAVNNLEVDDFECRYLVVKSAWQNTAETYLIERFHPVWNNECNVCYGIGKHGDAAKTRSNTRSPWDTLHPGRPWALGAGNQPNPLTPMQIKALIANHFKKFPPRK